MCRPIPRLLHTLLLPRTTVSEPGRSVSHAVADTPDSSCGPPTSGLLLASLTSAWNRSPSTYPSSANSTSEAAAASRTMDSGRWPLVACCCTDAGLEMMARNLPQLRISSPNTATVSPTVASGLGLAFGCPLLQDISIYVCPNFSARSLHALAVACQLLGKRMQRSCREERAMQERATQGHLPDAVRDAVAVLDVELASWGRFLATISKLTSVIPGARPSSKCHSSSSVRCRQAAVTMCMS
eukprot:SM000010S04365  [mRNA]  locus=s10:1094005:1094836:+ [translate_table: standard]